MEKWIVNINAKQIQESSLYMNTPGIVSIMYLISRYITMHPTQDKIKRLIIRVFKEPKIQK